jgi:hypothetical protein
MVPLLGELVGDADDVRAGFAHDPLDPFPGRAPDGRVAAVVPDQGVDQRHRYAVLFQDRGDGKDAQGQADAFFEALLVDRVRRTEE